jgi:hypothetical protein
MAELDPKRRVITGQGFLFAPPCSAGPSSGTPLAPESERGISTYLSRGRVKQVGPPMPGMLMSFPL